MNAAASPHSISGLRFVEDEQARDALLGVFEKAQEIECAAPDEKVLVMLVSRRLPCLYEMLVAGGDIDRFDPDKFEVVTDRVLDTGREEWSGRRVVLVDDVMNVGTTLVDRYDELCELVGDPGLVTVLVALRDEDRSNPDFMRRMRVGVEAEGGPLERGSEQLDTLAEQLAKCMYRSLTPYFTDFPILAKIKADSAALDRLLSTERWMVADVTAPIISGDGQRAYTFIPTADTEKRIRGEAWAPAMALADLLKVRVYTSEPEAGGYRWWRIVPIGVPAAVMPVELESAVDALAAELAELHGTGDSGLRRDSRQSRWKPRAEHRLLQMYISVCVAAEFWHDLEKAEAVTEPFCRDDIEDGRLQSYFGSDFEGAMRAFDHAIAFYNEVDAASPAASERLFFEVESSLWADREVRKAAYMMGELTRDANGRGGSAAEPAEPRPGELAALDAHKVWVQRILSVFGVIDTELEKTQAKKLTELSYDDYERYRSGEDSWGLGPRVMGEGIRLSELAKAVTDASNPDDVWRRALPSLALDIGNDLGVAVPITTDSGTNQPVFRQYRSGEGAFLAGKPHHLLIYATRKNTSSLLDHLTRDAIPKDTESSDWVFEEASYVRPCLQQWVGQVTEVANEEFAANSDTVLGGEGTKRDTSQGEGARIESVWENIKSAWKNSGTNALVEFRVCGTAGASPLAAWWSEVVGERFAASATSAMLGVSQEVLTQRQSSGSMLGLPGEHTTWFPSWQFDQQAGCVRPVVERITSAFRDRLGIVDPMLVASWAKTPQQDLDGNTPADLIETGDESKRIVQAARRAAARLAQ